MAVKIVHEFKFNVGEIVQIKGSNQRFLIGNLFTETCSAGTQILYSGIILMKRDRISFKDEPPEYVAMADKPLSLNETFLEKCQ
jgi:hypothetical protein